FGLFSPAVGGLMGSYGPGAGLLLCGAFGLVAMVMLALVSARKQPAPEQACAAPALVTVSRGSRESDASGPLRLPRLPQESGRHRGHARRYRRTRARNR